MIGVSRRAFLQSAAALVSMPSGTISVACTLDESRWAFRDLPAFTRASRGRVLVESSAGYIAEDLKWLREFGISVGAPLNVRGPAWVRFTWPIEVMIRDFGRVCPVVGGEVIARLGDIPVAARKGQFIILGSPLGPHVYAGDRDACYLLRAMTHGVKKDIVVSAT